MSIVTQGLGRESGLLSTYGFGIVPRFVEKAGAIYIQARHRVFAFAASRPFASPASRVWRGLAPSRSWRALAPPREFIISVSRSWTRRVKRVWRSVVRRAFGE